MTSTIKRAQIALFAVLFAATAGIAVLGTTSLVSADHGTDGLADHCPDHNGHPGKVNNPAASSTTPKVVDGVQVNVHVSADKKSVSFTDENGDPINVEFCIKASDNAGGKKSGTSGSVFWTNNGHNTPTISYVVVYKVIEKEAPKKAWVCREGKVLWTTPQQDETTYNSFLKAFAACIDPNVYVCRDGEVVRVKRSEAQQNQETYHYTRLVAKWHCKTPGEEPRLVEVCDPETKEVIPVPEADKDQYLPVDDPACQPGNGDDDEEEKDEDEGEVLGETTDVTPTSLPETGNGLSAIVAIATAVAGVATVFSMAVKNAFAKLS